MGSTAFDSNRLASDWLQHAAQQQPGASALVLQDASFDYASLHSLTAQLCQLLRSQGLKPGAIIVVESRSAALLAFLLHAALCADFVLLPLDPRLPDGQSNELMEQTHADLILSEDDAANLLAQAGQAQPICAAKSLEALARISHQSARISRSRFIFTRDYLTERNTSVYFRGKKIPCGKKDQARSCRSGEKCGLDRPRLLIATSGSCGLPKLVKLSDSNLQASVHAANQRLKLSHTSVWLDCLPLVHIGGLSILLRCACAGASLVLHEGFDARSVVDDLHNHQVSHISLVPAMLAQLLELAKQPPRSLQVVLVGGAPLEPSLAGRALAAGWPVWVTYGMTETASMLAARKLGTGDDNPRQVGSPLPGFELRIVDEVIEVRGAAVHHSGNRYAGQWFSTGDRGQLDKAGRLTLMGRTDSMLLSGGEKVYPERVEQLLANCAGIDEVAVTGQADPVWGERVVAVYCGDIDAAALAQLCRNGIEGVMRPRTFVKVESLPRTTNGKLDRAALRGLVADRL
ncbi:MAG: AMP-binding protein [Pseudomonadota bacterium]|nr:AMP-binding protein [Pseudomonadota bacterium]